MNIQIFGKSKCFDTKKAERYFKERRIKYQYIDILKYGMSMGELRSVRAGVKDIEKLINYNISGSEILKYLGDNSAKEEKLFEYPEFIMTPVVRNGKKATVGYCPEIWKEWEKEQ